jgi:hypothetical protein
MADVTWYIAWNPVTQLPSTYREIPAGRALEPLKVAITVPDGLPLDVANAGINAMLEKARNYGPLLLANTAVELTLTAGPTWPVPETPGGGG